MDHYANKELNQDSDSDDGVSNAYEDVCSCIHAQR